MTMIVYIQRYGILFGWDSTQKHYRLVIDDCVLGEFLYFNWGLPQPLLYSYQDVLAEIALHLSLPTELWRELDEFNTQYVMRKH
ncbi:hypothetical protein [Vibrio mediterranei]|uniref:hypothetical protein n=1 Tax=Vibrio mediterranei TaxID=689 RepID=UPI00148D12FB|nr:hypothetical protein [Vibrio mediterranei]NOI26620.1 hypothetical protein [Vibrio mediterranei]